MPVNISSTPFLDSYRPGVYPFGTGLDGSEKGGRKRWEGGPACRTRRHARRAGIRGGL